MPSLTLIQVCSLICLYILFIPNVAPDSFWIYSSYVVTLGPKIGEKINQIMEGYTIMKAVPGKDHDDVERLHCLGGTEHLRGSWRSAGHHNMNGWSIIVFRNTFCFHSFC